MLNGDITHTRILLKWNTEQLRPKKRKNNNKFINEKASPEVGFFLFEKSKKRPSIVTAFLCIIIYYLTFSKVPPDCLERVLSL